MILLVYVKGAKNLANLDEFSESDPYLDVVMMDNQSNKAMAHRCTKTFDDDLHPLWKELFAINITNFDLEGCNFTLNCTVFDHDIGEADDPIGNVSLDLRHPHIANAAELGSNMDWIAHSEHTYKLVDLPEPPTRFAPESQLTLSMVKVSKIDFVWWCDRMGINAAATIHHGVTTALKSSLHRARNNLHEVVNDKARREALTYLESVSKTDKRTPKRHSLALMIETEQGRGYCRKDKRAINAIAAFQQGTGSRRTTSRPFPSKVRSFGPSSSPVSPKLSQKSVSTGISAHVVCKANCTGWVRQYRRNKGHGEVPSSPELLAMLDRIRSSARVVPR
jgi:hypothetical protein